MNNSVLGIENIVQKLCQYLNIKEIACNIYGFEEDTPCVIFRLYFPGTEELVMIDFPKEVLSSYSDNDIFEYLKCRYDHNVLVESNNITSNTIQ